MAREPGKRIPRRSLEDTRILVVHAVENGMGIDDAAHVFECGRSTVFGWVKAHREQGPEALKVKNAPGPEPKLTTRGDGPAPRNHDREGSAGSSSWTSPCGPGIWCGR